MTATTPIFGLPYPLGTDPVANGDDDIKALAQKLELILNPVVITPTLAASVGPPSAGWAMGPMRIYKIGKVCVLTGGQDWLTTGVALSPAPLFTSLPATVRPVANLGGACMYGGSNAVGFFRLETSGALTTYGPAFPANSTIAVNATWVTAG